MLLNYSGGGFAVEAPRRIKAPRDADRKEDLHLCVPYHITYRLDFQSVQKSGPFGKLIFVRD